VVVAYFNVLFRSCLKRLGKTREISVYPVPGPSCNVKPDECHVLLLDVISRLRGGKEF